MPVHSRAFTELREQVWSANRAIVEAGLVVLTFGNASGIDRAAGVVAIKPSGVPYGTLTPDGIVLVDLEAGTAIAGSARPSSDTPTHVALYRSFEAIGGIVHTHSRHATAWAQAHRAIPCLGTTHADHFSGSVPVTRALTTEEVSTVYERATGEAIVELFTLEGLDPVTTPAALVHSHGPFAWGADAAEAVENAVALEEVAALAALTVAAWPGAVEIDSALRDKHFQRKHGSQAYYGQGDVRGAEPHASA